MENITNEPGVERYMILNCPAHAKRINNGAGVVSNWINAGYKVQTMCPITEGYVGTRNTVRVWWIRNT